MKLIEIRLNNGTEIAACMLHQACTYGGEVDADNYEFQNKFVMDGVEEVSKDVLGDFPVFVVAPDVEKNEDGSEQFPAIECGARFWSFILDPDNEYDYLVTIIVWFQDELFTRIPSHIEEQIKRIDWERMAAPARW